MTKWGSEERTLDPSTEAERIELRKLAHRMVDEAFEHIERRRDQPVWQRPPEVARQLIEGRSRQPLMQEWRNWHTHRT